jgi:hypothetical protein
MNPIPQHPIAAEPEARHPALGLLVVAPAAIALWAVIIEAARILG